MNDQKYRTKYLKYKKKYIYYKKYRGGSFKDLELGDPSKEGDKVWHPSKPSKPPSQSKSHHSITPPKIKKNYSANSLMSGVRYSPIKDNVKHFSRDDDIEMVDPSWGALRKRTNVGSPPLNQNQALPPPLLRRERSGRTLKKGILPYTHPSVIRGPPPTKFQRDYPIKEDRLSVDDDETYQNPEYDRDDVFYDAHPKLIRGPSI